MGKSSGNFRNEPWYPTIRAEVRRLYVGRHQSLTVAQVESVFKAYGLGCPDRHTLESLAVALQRFLREVRQAELPQFTTDEEFERFTIGDLTPVLERLGLDKAKVDQARSALQTCYLPFLKEVHGGNPANGLNHLMLAESMRLRFLTPAFFEPFDAWFRDHVGEFDPAVQSRIRAIRGMFFESGANPFGSRTKKYGIGSPEIEGLMAEYVSKAKSRSAAKTATSEARNVLSLAGISSKQELLSQQGQMKIIRLEFDGRFGQYQMSRPRSFFRWVYERERVPYPAYFADLSKEEIFPLDSAPEIAALIQKVWPYLQKSLAKYENSNLDKLKVFVRFLLRTSGARSCEEFFKIKPSIFVEALYEAEARENHLDSFTAIKMFTTAFLDEVPREIQWPESFGQTYEEFKSELESSRFADLSETAEVIRYSDFEAAFRSTGGNWRSFFEALKKHYYHVVERQRGQDDVPRVIKKRIAPDDFDKAQQFVLEQAFGRECGNRNKAAIKAPDGKFRSGGLLRKGGANSREIEFLVAFAIQAVVASRFGSEASKLVYSESVPDFSECEGTHKLFFWPEKRCYAIFFSADRKNDIPCLAPLNDLTDQLVHYYLKITQRKHGERFFSYNTPKLTDEIKRFGNLIFKDKLEFQHFVDAIPNRGFVPHAFRHVLRRAIEGRYTGSDRELMATLALGHKIPRDSMNRSSVAESYGNYVNYSFDAFDRLRRIKNGIFLTDAEIKLRDLEEQGKRGHEKTQELIGHVADLTKAGIATNVALYLERYSDEEKLVLMKQILESSPHLLSKMLK